MSAGDERLRLQRELRCRPPSGVGAHSLPFGKALKALTLGRSQRGCGVRAAVVANRDVKCRPWNGVVL